ncbi:tyrosine-type recombinase/integrase [Gudongella sp. DL1XJH-153]|uniref:tyrosine-type recombinase/integrase n=1 Tax=Gudongella sp. DL1XJH-153 TaxID=3409804 RepID=UPI003BB71A8F
MARKPVTNTQINGYKYNRKTLVVGHDSEGVPIVKQFYGKTQREAEEKRDKYKQMMDNGINPDLGSLPLEKAMSDWLWNIERYSGNKTSTFERYEGIFRNYIEGSMLSNIQVSQVNKLVVQKYYNEFLESGKTISFVKQLHKLLSKFFRYALSEGYILRNPLFGLKLPKTDEEEIVEYGEEIDTFTDEEVKQIINSLDNVKLKYIILFAVLTGARMGEILALKKKDIKDGVVMINKSIRKVRVYSDKENYTYQYKVTRPKTESSRREVPLPDKLINELKNLDILVKEERLRLGPAYDNNDILFPSITGTYIDDKNLRRSWERALSSSGVDYKKFHALRHTYATRMIENGVELLTVSRLLGHSSIKTTEVYAHTLEDTKIEAVKTLDSMFQ